MKLSQNYLNGTNVAVPVRALFTSTTVKQFYRFLPVYHGTNCPPYLRPSVRPSVRRWLNCDEVDVEKLSYVAAS